jgi:hypothetical protein
LIATLAAKSRKTELVIVPALAAPRMGLGNRSPAHANRRQAPLALPREALFSPPEKCYAFSAFVQHLRE